MKKANSVVIVGGGIAAASMAIQLLREASQPLSIVIVEPREHAGRGLAYSAEDPDHRLNHPIDNHNLDPNQPRELRTWCEETGVLDRDPECFTPGGHIFLRRRDLGAFVAEQVSRHSQPDALGSSIKHVRALATHASKAGSLYVVSTLNGPVLHADLLIVATGNAVPSLRPPFAPRHATDPRIIANPLEPGCLDAIPTHASVLVVGGGLTALDILSTLVRRGTHAKLVCISRRGLRPRQHSSQIVHRLPAAYAQDVDLSKPVPEFLRQAPLTALGLSRALRRQILKTQDEGRTWHLPFDELRDAVFQVWPALPMSEKQRFLKRLRIFYDVHRFRTPPMNDKMVKQAEQAGVVQFQAATLKSVTEGPDGALLVEMDNTSTHSRLSENYDCIVNCTGIESAVSWRANPFLLSLVEQGLLLPHATGLGFDVGPQCEALSAGGASQARLRVIGPPTAGVFGDPLGVPFIAAQVKRILPDVLATLCCPPRMPADHPAYPTFVP